MKEYISIKPATRYADQWFPGKAVEGVRYDEKGHYVITIHEQPSYLEPGDWVAREPGRTDRHYPIKDNIFRESYKLKSES
jgi:hypothetical protein